MTDGARSGSHRPQNLEQAGSYATLPAPLRRFEIAPGGCWIWYSRSKHNGYAQATSYKGKKGSPYKLIWEYLNGPVPEGLELDHLCNNGAGGCVNPAHLKPCTHRENLLRDGSRSITKPLAEATHCKNGHEFTPENTIYPNKTEKGKVKAHWRACRTCHRETHRRWLKNNRERARELAKQSRERAKQDPERMAKLQAKRERAKERAKAKRRAS